MILARPSAIPVHPVSAEATCPGGETGMPGCYQRVMQVSAKSRYRSSPVITFL